VSAGKQPRPVAKRKGFFVHPDTHRRLKVYAAANVRFLQDVTEEAITNWLEAEKKKEGQDGQSAQS
jgi:hypothetical protein